MWQAASDCPTNGNSDVKLARVKTYVRDKKIIKIKIKKR